MREQEWQHLALWLADCEAATAEYYLHTKSAPAHERKRHIHICRELRKMLSTGYFHGTTSKEDRVMDRLLDVANRAEKK